MSTSPFRRALGAAATLAVSTVLAGCGAGAGATGTAPAGPPQPGGTLRFAVSSDQGCVDPQQVASNDSIYSLRQLVDSLTDQDPQTGELRPGSPPRGRSARTPAPTRSRSSPASPSATAPRSTRPP